MCFITVAGFLNGPGFQKMRADLRRDADEIWVIDCSPEGHQPPVATRVFQGVQQPVCIVMALRRGDGEPETPAKVRFRSLPEGVRGGKFTALAGVGLDDSCWVDAPTEWRAPFLPAGDAAWESYPALEDLFVYNGSGVMAGRTWVIAPDAKSLRDRWAKLVAEKDPANKEKLFHPHQNGDRTVTKVVRNALAGHPHPPGSVEKDPGVGADPVRYAFRSFDRQWLLPDNRVINRPNPTLWDSWSKKQVYLTAPHDRTPTAGPALALAASIPDLHHYHGRGGRVFPLWADAAATQPNIALGLLKELRAHVGEPVSAEDVMAYLAAVAAHPAYVASFRKNLKQPGLRVPFTADRTLFDRAVELGREVIWLHTFGERFAKGRPAGPPRIKNGPENTKEGPLPKTLAAMPHELDYDPVNRRLMIGKGWISNVDQAVWDYEVSGKRVLSQWWSYRRDNRVKPAMGDRRAPSELSDIKPKDWPAEYTAELMNVLHVLTGLVALEPAQATLLAEIVNGPKIEADVLRAHGALSDASAEVEATEDEAEADEVGG